MNSTNLTLKVEKVAFNLIRLCLAERSAQKRSNELVKCFLVLLKNNPVMGLGFGLLCPGSLFFDEKNHHSNTTLWLFLAPLWYSGHYSKFLIIC